MHMHSFWETSQFDENMRNWLDPTIIVRHGGPTCLSIVQENSACCEQNAQGKAVALQDRRTRSTPLLSSRPVFPAPTSGCKQFCP